MLKTSIALGFFLTQSLPLNPQVQGVANHLIGVMDTTQQAQTNPRVAKVQMTTCAVNFSPKQDSIYLYQEQAIIDRLNQPYRQRILVIQPSADNSTVESKAYKLNNAANFINFCNKYLTERR
ncbi:MAG: CpcT/CpeT family chromophore lyase, partial [Microcystis panniformis]